MSTYFRTGHYREKKPCDNAGLFMTQLGSLKTDLINLKQFYIKNEH